ncbi:hypothetical protein CDD80_5600 [Ophiocordyceps camponoti-rufipedis]|uniref:RRM domain-containing protein n=1 Tax=Ophiocordyceps camponoti-rufipedis TaxID=2004952 RepID=A0A2C5XFZ0_9HYPO|nr:hypothetical protein CDD80_5600 [Ophiocordyceps camponoti-rufipedis]
MAYAPPPGTNSLPARPPASSAGKQGFRPAFASAQPYQAPPAAYSASHPNNYPAPSPATNYPSRPQYGQQYGAFPSSSYQGYPAPGVNSSAQGYGYASQQHHGQQPSQQHQQPQPQHHQQQGYAPQNAPSYSASSYAPPQIQNPFPAPGSAAATHYDPTEAAQIAEWQSTYNTVVPPASRDGKPLPLLSEPSKPDSPVTTAAAAAAAANSSDKKQTVVRQGGGKSWTDDTLLEWDPSHLRLFVGNLAGETTDESLLKAFSRWKSVQKARVIRDKRTTKSKGYGFVSFSNADDFFQAAKEMNGKYIQSHPVVVRKANTEIKVSDVNDKAAAAKHNSNKSHNKNNKKKNGKSKNSSHHNGSGVSALGAAYEPGLGPVSGAGITKPGQKTKNGLRLLG